MGRVYYIVGTYCRYFYNVCIRDTRLSADHRIILSELKGNGQGETASIARGGPPGPLWAL